jgi:hypothetical protein
MTSWWAQLCEQLLIHWERIRKSGALAHAGIHPFSEINVVYAFVHEVVNNFARLAGALLLRLRGKSCSKKVLKTRKKCSTICGALEHSLRPWSWQIAIFSSLPKSSLLVRHSLGLTWDKLPGSHEERGFLVTLSYAKPEAKKVPFYFGAGTLEYVLNINTFAGSKINKLKPKLARICKKIYFRNSLARLRNRILLSRGF